MVPTDNAGHIPAIYGEFIAVFSKEAETLPPHRSIDYVMNLEPSYKYPFGRIYNFSELSRVVFTQSRRMRSCAQEPDHGFGFGLQRSHALWIVLATVPTR